MSVFAAIGLIVLGLAAVALIILALDVARGDVGGGRHTLERARRLLVVATDDRTREGADRWIEEQRREHPQQQFFVLVGYDGQQLFMDVESAVERERPDAVIVARHEEESHTTLEGTYGRLKDDLSVPVDAIYISKEAGT
jgi:hypothetical protein